jgi:hypothetical protein
MSTKRRYIQEANLISEQRYLNNKFLMETDDPITPQLQTSTNVAKLGVNVNDVATQKSILSQLQQHSNNVDLEKLKPLVGSPNFFIELENFVTLEPETSKIDKKTITGEELKLTLPGGLKLKGTFDIGTGGKLTGLSDIGLNKNVNIGGTPVKLGVKYKNPLGNFNVNKIQVGAKINIPNTNKNKSHFARL